jgi:signal peptidase II
MKSKLPYLSIALIVLIADLGSKAWATLTLKPILSVEIIPEFFRFSYATNRGVAFSMFADSEFNMRWVLAAISIAAALIVLGYLLRTLPSQRRLNCSLALLLAGIVGNLIDRIRTGEVVDFIEVHYRNQYFWPTFNIADSAICVGAALLALEMLREAKTESPAQALPVGSSEKGAD